MVVQSNWFTTDLLCIAQLLEKASTSPIWQNSDGQDYPLWHSLNTWEPEACPEHFSAVEPGQSLIIMWEKVASGQLPFLREILPVLSVLPLPCPLLKGSKESKTTVTLYYTTFRLRFCNRFYTINYSVYFILVMFGWNFWRHLVWAHFSSHWKTEWKSYDWLKAYIEIFGKIASREPCGCSSGTKKAILPFNWPLPNMCSVQSHLMTEERLLNLLLL